MSVDYKDTLNLPKTDFEMRANLAQREPAMIERWESSKIYDRMIQARRQQNAPQFLLHDGPPYANGNIHHGHILNKVLKDFVVKFKNMDGFKAEFVPGWDCHGLPIEHQVDKELGAKKAEMSKVDVRKACRVYADKYVSIQRDEFKRMMVFADWENPYKTMSYQYEAATVRELGKFLGKGLVYRGLKPVHWDWASQTALAEAEVEYAEHTTEHVYVKFPFEHLPEELKGANKDLPTYVVIWTTTPWTLPANLAIALHPELDYQFVEVAGEVLVMAEGLRDSTLKACGIEDFEVLNTFKGRVLVGELGEGRGLEAAHPFIDRPSVLLPADYVTLEQGTGCVHTAPGHGQEDFGLGQVFGLETLCPVDFRGCFMEALVPEWGGMHVFKANPLIQEFLAERGLLLNKVGDKIKIERYPHGWRSKKPVIFRATTQWFIAMEAESANQQNEQVVGTQRADMDLRGAVLSEIEKVQWVPKWGRDRIVGMVENRPDWCISRQRSWGVPITVMHCQSCGNVLASEAIANHVADLVEEEGADVWFEKSPAELVPPGTSCAKCGSGPESFSKENDILDVWFDSGTSWAAVLEGQLKLGTVADLYLEGSDQHRGWFQSSIMCGVGTRGHAPYRTCLTHGFVMDTEGRKYSKSSKNFEPPQKMIDTYGAEILRLWVAAVDYRGDISLSTEIIKRMSDAYRKVRNTFRFLLGNLDGFDPNHDLVAYEDMLEEDRWLLNQTAEVVNRCRQAYNEYQFHTVFHTSVQFCTVDLSNVHLDLAKDRMYCDAADSKARRSGQSAYFLTLHALVRVLAPVLSFTAEEVWDLLPKLAQDPDSVHLTDFPSKTLVEPWLDSELSERWERLLEIRGEVQKALEAVRAPKNKKEPGQIGSSQEADVTVWATGSDFDLLSKYESFLATLFITSYARVEKGDEFKVDVAVATDEKCPRCWNYWVKPESEHEICPRCANVLADGTHKLD